MKGGPKIPGWTDGYFTDSSKIFKSFVISELSGKSCPLGPELDPSFGASSPPGCFLQSHEILLNKGMKYWDSGLNAWSARTFIATVHIVAEHWLVEGVQEKKGQGKLSFAPNLLLNWVSWPLEAQCSIVFRVFWNLIPYLRPNRGFQCRLFLTLRITLLKTTSSLSCIVQL
jgi:hypothetical protein